MTKYTILQSGFITKDSKELILSDPINADNVNTALRLGRAPKDNRSPYHYHNKLDQLYEEYTANGRALANFDFREKLLVNLIEAIDSKNFLDWVSFQCKSEFYNRLHHRFLLDTIKFINTGKREIVIDSWIYLIKADKLKKDSEDLPNLDLFQCDVHLVEDIIARWTSHRYGFKDLIYFAKIVFGKTTVRKIG